MQISTKISTQIVLNQDELTEAVIDYIKARTEVPADAKFGVEFEDDVNNANDLTAVVNIAGTSGATGSTGSGSSTGSQKPKTQRRNSAPTPKTEVLTIQDPPTEEVPNITASPEDRQDPNNPEPPFEPETSEPKTQVKVEEKPLVEDSPKPSTAPKIFPDVTTSAPTPPKVEEEVDPTVKAKSLFANLSKPTN